MRAARGKRRTGSEVAGNACEGGGVSVEPRKRRQQCMATANADPSMYAQRSADARRPVRTHGI